MRHATRIVKSMVEFIRRLPEKYQKYFKGSEHLPSEERSKLVEQITEDEGLTLLKIGISRILLLRVLFNADALVMPQRQKALLDGALRILGCWLCRYVLMLFSSCRHSSQRHNHS